MGTLLEALRRLQDAHTKLTAVRARQETKQRDVRSRQRKVDETRQKLDSLHQRLRDQQKQIDEVDLEIKSRESMINKHREELNRARTNREYATILTTLNTEKADVARLENRTLELMGGLDKLRAEKDEAQAELEKAQQRVREAQAALEEFNATSGAELEQLTEERSRAAARIPPDILLKFERAAERHDGEALAAVIKPHPKREEYSCGACNMGVTLQQMNALVGRDEIQWCNVCGAILYLSPELDTAKR